jgi:hypothetical protein
MLWSSGIEYASLQELPDHFPGVFSVPIWAHWCVRSAEAVCSLPVSSSSFVFYDHKWEQSETYLSVEISHFARRITMYIWSQLTRCQRNFCMKIYILARTVDWNTWISKYTARSQLSEKITESQSIADVRCCFVCFGDPWSIVPCCVFSLSQGDWDRGSPATNQNMWFHTVT